jgi:acyl-CoA thioester hydrolase
MSIDAPLRLYHDTVRPEWIDYNGHMNLAYYVVVFDLATDAFLDFLGLGESYARRTGCSVFALETHVNYIAEMKTGESMQFATQLLDYDSKRAHFFHSMYDGSGKRLVSTSELLVMHMVVGVGASAFPESIEDKLAQVYRAHEKLPRNVAVGRPIGIRRGQKKAPGARKGGGG